MTTDNPPLNEHAPWRLLRAHVPSEPETRHVLSEFERLMDASGCPSCRYVAEAEQSFFSWFGIESFSTTEMQARLRRAIGMCPRHSRRLVEQLGNSHVMTTVLREALAGARQAMHEELERGTCPACEVTARAGERACSVVLDGLLDPSNVRTFQRHHGLCLPHLVQAARAAQATTLAVLAQRLLETLQTGGSDAQCDALAGLDEDAGQRAGWRRHLPAPHDGATTIGRLNAQLGVQSCPACLGTGLGETRYLEWFVERAREHDASLRTDPGELCSAHLHDLELADRAAAREAAQRKRGARVAELRQLLGRLAELPSPAIRKRRNAAEDIDRVREKLVSAHYCPACHARDQIDRSRLGLVLASIELSSVRERYERSHGLCVHHALQVRGERSAGAVFTHLAARLGVLAWEVDETARKYAWACRHEDAGPETDAWARALVQLDGRVFIGAPAPASSALGDE